MKKILVIHNVYNLRGGEDIAVEKEIDLLKKYYDVKLLNYFNDISNPFSQFVSFITNYNKGSVKKLKEKLSEFNPDVVYIHNTWFKASLGIFKLLEKSNVKVILKLHNFRYDCTKSFKIKSHLKNRESCPACGLQKKSSRYFNKYFKESFIKSLFVIIYGKKYFKILKNNNISILVLTNFHKEYLRNLGIKESKLFAFPNYLNLKETINQDDPKDYLIYAGRVSEEKGVEELISSFLNAVADKTKLKIVGEGPLLGHLKSKFKVDNIQFYGQKSNDEVYKLISESRGVITATKLFEGQPMLLCEASLIGVPSIYPRSGGINEFFPKDSQLSFEQFNYYDLEEKINKLLVNKSIYKEGHRNKIYIQDYLEEEEILKKFESIIHGK